MYVYVYVHVYLSTQGAGGRELGTRHFVAGGFLAGCVAAVATAPIDLIKTRIQVCQGYDGGIADIGRRILREEGLGAFTKGLGARVVWVAPGCAVRVCVCVCVCVCVPGRLLG